MYDWDTYYSVFVYFIHTAFMILDKNKHGVNGKI